MLFLYFLTIWHIQRDGFCYERNRISEQHPAENQHFKSKNDRKNVDPRIPERKITQYLL